MCSGDRIEEGSEEVTLDRYLLLGICVGEVRRLSAMMTMVVEVLIDCERKNLHWQSQAQDNF
jgi:hypothetical protein